MSALMSDLLDGTIQPTVANAVCKAGSNLLKVNEMHLKYGQTDTRKQSLRLTL
jgi:hypothetical protein